jgi:ornithine carbamoyltransferase
MPEVVNRAGELARESGGALHFSASMEEAFDGAEVVYPKSWAPFAVMEERTRLVGTGDRAALAELEKRCLANNARFKAWQCTDALMARSRDALYLHCLPADISGVSCPEGEVSAPVFDRFRVPLYRQAGYKPYIIAAMMLAARREDTQEALSRVMQGAGRRIGSR